MLPFIPFGLSDDPAISGFDSKEIVLVLRRLEDFNYHGLVSFYL